MTASADTGQSVPHELWRILRSHPRHLPERLVLLAVGRQGAPAKEWASERLAKGVEPREASERLRASTVIESRLHGTVAGTPFFVALVPAYVTFLWVQAQMVLRIAALQGRDPTDPALAAEVLVLRGVYRSIPEAQEALDSIGEEPPETGRRGRIAAWVDLVKRILILAAFTSASNPDEQPGRARQAGTFVLGVGMWVVTFVMPVTFMILMAWSCASSTRQLGAIALEYYSGKAVDDVRSIKAVLRMHQQDPARGRRRFVRWLLLSLSVAVPIGFLAVTVSKGDAVSDGGRAIAALIALSLVIAAAVVLRRRY